MHPPFSVIFFTTLGGLGQGLFIALFSYSCMMTLTGNQPDPNFLFTASLLSFVLLTGGLISSIFHLGHPERGWRAASQWRTSWLSREVIILPLVISLVFSYTFLLYFTGIDAFLGQIFGHFTSITPLLGSVTSVMIFILFACTSMIYACLRFLQEWSTPLTLINFTLLGLASGFCFATAIAGSMQLANFDYFLLCSIILILLAWIARSLSLYRNKRLRPISTIQTALGINHPHIRQISNGAMGGSFNTREFFHGKTLFFIRSAKLFFIVTTFIIPLVLLSLIAYTKTLISLAVAAVIIHYIGLVVERWYFFAEARHPQNIYYQAIA